MIKVRPRHDQDVKGMWPAAPCGRGAAVLGGGPRMCEREGGGGGGAGDQLSSAVDNERILRAVDVAPPPPPRNPHTHTRTAEAAGTGLASARLASQLLMYGPRSPTQSPPWNRRQRPARVPPVSSRRTGARPRAAAALRGRPGMSPLGPGLACLGLARARRRAGRRQSTAWKVNSSFKF